MSRQGQVHTLRKQVRELTEKLGVVCGTLGSALRDLDEEQPTSERERDKRLLKKPKEQPTPQPDMKLVIPPITWEDWEELLADRERLEATMDYLNRGVIQKGWSREIIDKHLIIKRAAIDEARGGGG